MLQLATEKVMIRLPKTVRGKTTIEDYHAQQVIEKYQVTPAQVIELKALMGDSADNIPGIPGVGEKTATKLIVEYGSIENAYQHVEEIKPNKARESLRERITWLSCQKHLQPLIQKVQWISPMKKPDWAICIQKEAFALCKRLDFKNLLARFDQTMSQELTEVKEFFTCEDLSGCEALFEKAGKQKVVGTALLSDKEEVYGLGLAITEQEIYYIPVANFITGPYLCGKIADLALNTRICAIDIKTMLKHVNLEEEHQVFDAGVAAYLLNPLKSTYTCEDLAREYEGGKIIPSRKNFLERHPLERPGRRIRKGFPPMPAIQQKLCFPVWSL